MSRDRKGEINPPPKNSLLLRYWTGVWTVGMTFIITLLISPWVPPDISSLFLVAVMYSAWRGGLGVG